MEAYAKWLSSPSDKQVIVGSNLTASTKASHVRGGVNTGEYYEWSKDWKINKG